jgi:hypothetical protein
VWLVTLAVEDTILWDENYVYNPIFYQLEAQNNEVNE